MIYNANAQYSVDKAAKKLLKGDIIIYPTDTLYGFGVDATNTKSIEKLNKIKKRNQVYSILVNSIDMMKNYSNINVQQEKKIKKYLPGPFTIILLKRCSNLSNLVSLNLKTIGVRIPNNIFCQKIIALTEKPMITTSVNIHGSKPLNQVNAISKQFPYIDIFKDKNLNKNSKGSTIIDFSKGKASLIRIGDGAYCL